MAEANVGAFNTYNLLTARSRNFNTAGPYSISTAMKKPRFITVGRNVTWTYSRFVPSRFPGAGPVAEEVQSYKKPELAGLPAGSAVSLEIFGGLIKLHLDGEIRRISVEQHGRVYFDSEDDARTALETLWTEIEDLDSLLEIRDAIRAWLASF
jgi:hypothetical protein